MKLECIETKKTIKRLVYSRQVYDLNTAVMVPLLCRRIMLWKKLRVLANASVKGNEDEKKMHRVFAGLT